MAETERRGAGVGSFLATAICSAAVFGGWFSFQIFGQDNDATWGQVLLWTALACVGLIGFGGLVRSSMIVGLGAGIAMGFTMSFALALVVLVSVGS